jgi:sulfur dioxygenase
VYPAHDYKGDTVSTIAEERAHNPRLQVACADEYAEVMNSLNLSNPKMMDVAVPANRQQGLIQEQITQRGWACNALQAQKMLGHPDVKLIDLRETRERERHGCIRGGIHVPYSIMEAQVGPGGMLHELARSEGKTLLFYCAFGERSAMAVQAAQLAGLKMARHIQGGLDAWKKAGGPVD